MSVPARVVRDKERHQLDSNNPINGYAALSKAHGVEKDEFAVLYR